VPPVSPTNGHGVFVLLGPGCGSKRVSFLDCLDLFPIVCGRIGAVIAGLGESQEEKVGLVIFGVAPTATLSHSDETKGLSLTNGWCDKAVRHAIFNEVQLCDRQPSVVVSAMPRKLYFDPRDDPVGR
jgi:hypothetical protein